jgi:hypothetical protein
MEVSFQIRKLDAAGLAASNHTVPKETPTPRSMAYEQVALENSRALTHALRMTPEIREEIVRRATELVGEPSYPPEETIRKISDLLAIQLDPES